MTLRTPEPDASPIIFDNTVLSNFARVQANDGRQRLYEGRAFICRAVLQEFSARYLVDGLHAIIAIYQEEQSIQLVRRFMKATGLVSNDMFMRTIEVGLKVIPRIGDERKRIPEEKALLDLWLAIFTN